MTLKNSTIATLDYIAVTKYNVPEYKGFFGSDETVQNLVLQDYESDKWNWRQKAIR